MKRAIDLLRLEPRGRVFFAVLTQSSLGTGAAYVALLLVAYERYHSPWAISVVLIADLLPPMLLGPVFGAMADRWSRKRCAIAGDVVRAFAFIALPLVSSFPATVALALVAGTGTALFTPSTLAALPSLVSPPRLPAATALYGAINDFGVAVGPGAAAAVLLVADPEFILSVNGATFVVSALALTRLDFGRAPERDEAPWAERASLLGDVKAGLTAIRGFRGLWAVLGTSSAALFFGGLVNVGELPFITEELDSTQALYSAVVALAGTGIVLGSLAGGSGGQGPTLVRRFVASLLVIGVGFVLTGLAGRAEVVLATFGLAGLGNGLMLVSERQIVQATVPDSMSARIFGVKDALGAWAFATSFVLAGALISASSARTVILLSGLGVAVVSLVGALGLWRGGAALPGRAGSQVGLDRGAGEDSPNLVGSRAHWLALLDDLD